MAKMSKNNKSPRKLSLVKFNFEAVPAQYRRKYPFRASKIYIYFGEIANMPGHCVVADHKTGKIYSGYHTENFIEINADEA